jgi:hypothetical protein
VFGGDGRAVINALIFPSSEDMGFNVFAMEGQARLVNLELYGLAP